jgi:hypothetical protein
MSYIQYIKETSKIHKERKLRLYVDDLRMPKGGGWTVVRDYNEARHILILWWDTIEEISLDHDLGTGLTGYDLACWIEGQIEIHGYKPIPKMYCHSANSVGRKNIEVVFNKYNK